MTTVPSRSYNGVLYNVDAELNSGALFPRKGKDYCGLTQKR